MRSRQIVMVAFLAVCGLALFAGIASADYAWPYVLPDTANDVLYLKPAEVVSGTIWNGGADDTVDGLVLNFTNPPDENDLSFSDDAGGVRQLIVHGLNHDLNMIRLWSAVDVPPDSVIIKTNTTDTVDPLAAGWTTLVPSFTLTGTWSDDLPAEEPGVALYHDFSVNSTGTKSLFFEFDNVSTTDSIRISEVQAYGQAVPEPSSILLLTSGLIGLMAYAWRKRK